MAILPGQIEEKKKYYCDKCQKTMSGENFYTSNNFSNSLVGLSIIFCIYVLV